MFQADTLSVGVTAVDLTASFNIDQEYELRVRPAAAGFRIGHASVVPSFGFTLPAGVPTVLQVPPGVAVYGVYDSGTANVDLLALSI